MKGLLGVLVLVMVGCGEETQNHIRIRYTQDSRTFLCFAVVQNSTDKNYTVSSITTVPCDQPEVVALLEPKLFTMDSH